MANPVGRPSLLTQDLKDRAREYLFSYEEQGDVIPSAAGLACWLGIAKSSVYLYSDQDEEFSDTLSAIQAKQETVTLNNGMTGKFNSTIAKLVLANHGYSDKVQQDVTTNGKDITSSGDAVLAALAAKHKD